MRIDQLRQFQYCPKRNRGMIPLWKLIAKNWIEHPSRNGDLESFGKPGIMAQAKISGFRKANYNQNGGTREMLFGKRPMQTLSRTFH